MKRILKSQKGIAMPLVIILFAVVFILTTASINAAFFDSKHSIIDENQTKAYYLARSAVDAVQESINMEINELKTLETSLMNAVINGTDTSYIVLLNTYNERLLFIEDNILPNIDGATYYHTVVGIDGIVSDVSVKRNTDNFRLEASATVNGSSAKAMLDMLIKKPTRNEDVIRSVTSTEIITETTTTTIPAGNPASFGDAMYSFGDMYLDNNISFHRNNKSGSAANGRFEGVEGGKQKIKKGTITQATTSTPLDPKTLLPTNIEEDIRFSTLVTTPLPNTITSANSGYYGTIIIPNNAPSNFTVNTSGGDVIIKLNRLQVNNNTRFHVTGSNNFYMYIEDNNISDGGLVVSGNNNLNFTSSTNTPQTYIILNQPPTDRNVDNNVFDIKNNMNFYGYVYAPYSKLIIKNNADVYGSLVAGGIEVKNNLDVIHISSNNGSSTTDGSGNRIITETTTRPETTTSTTTSTISFKTIQYEHDVDNNWLPK